MKVVVLDGNIENTKLSLKTEKVLADKLRDHEVEWIRLSEKNIKPCMGCFGCWIKTPGLCVINDDGNDIVRKMVNCDLVIKISPVTFGGYSSELKKMLDRSIPVLLPFFKNVKGEIHHFQRYQNVPRNLTIGYLEKPDGYSSECFGRLNMRNVLNLEPPKWQCVILDNPEMTEKVISDSLAKVTA